MAGLQDGRINNPSINPAFLPFCNPAILQFMDGLRVIDKPAGPTSHDVVARMRRVLGERRIGHTGTLDPNASGVLPLVIGRATRLAKFLSGGRKTYEAIVHLGIATDTYDAEGTPVGGKWAGPLPARPAFERPLDAFPGTFTQ